MTSRQHKQGTTCVGSVRDLVRMSCIYSRVATKMQQAQTNAIVQNNPFWAARKAKQSKVKARA